MGLFGMFCRKKEMTVKDKVERWLKNIAAVESLSDDIVAVNIGMFETENGYGVYMCGSKEYDEEDDDWACDADYEPGEKYLILEGKGFESMAWETLLNQMVLSLKEILKCGDESVRRFFGNRVLTTGFDEGNLIRVK